MAVFFVIGPQFREFGFHMIAPTRDERPSQWEFVLVYGPKDRADLQSKDSIRITSPLTDEKLEELRRWLETQKIEPTLVNSYCTRTRDKLLDLLALDIDAIQITQQAAE